MIDDRPSPDALLREARREGRGKLKILLGASPGVGKTYEMLREGADLLRAGCDVVVGLVETHGRADTEALVAPFEVIPRRVVEHGPHRLTELDLDALLARKPRTALVDEFAHTNAPGSRHPKRWQDIEELRDAGIDVVTTLNIQHVESLNDVVAGFTRVRVRETVPDATLDDAELELVDLPPDELIERLKAGKIYVPDEASRALGHFFSKSNLSALRELAMRRAAQTVDRQMLDHVRATGQAGQWGAGERLVVAVGDQPGGDALIRAAKRLADALNASWTAVAIETPRSATLPPEGRSRVAATLALAAHLGGTVATVPAASVVAGLTAYVGETRATAVVIGKSHRSWWFELRHGSVVDRLVRGLAGVAIHVVPVGGVGTVADRRTVARPWNPGGLGVALGLVAATTLIAYFALPLIGANSVDLLYLMPVIVAATRVGLRASLITSVAAALAYNFFFLPPLYTFTVADPHNIITLAVLVGVAVITSQLAGRLKREATVGARSASENAAIAAFGQRLAGVADECGTAQVVCDEVAGLLGVATVLLSRRDAGLVVVAATPADPALGPLDLAAADWADDRGEPAGRETTTLTASDWQFQPLRTSLGVLGVLGVRAERGDPVPGDRRLLFTTLLGQAALAHERIRLEAGSRELSALKQRDALRATLLASIGHDLRTPLTSVVAAAETLAAGALAAGSGLPAAATLKAEARRLRRVFDELVEMTRLEGGAVPLRMEATDLVDAIGAAVHDLRPELMRHRLVLDMPPGLPLVEADPRLLNHILINLLGNAAKFAPEGAAITIEGRRTASGVTLAVLDGGPGFPAGSEAALFDRFARVEGDDRGGGTGLGLAIVKGFAEAMGLTAAAANRNEGGARFSIAWPEALLRRATVEAAA